MHNPNATYLNLVIDGNLTSSTEEHRFFYLGWNDLFACLDSTLISW